MGFPRFLRHCAPRRSFHTPRLARPLVGFLTIIASALARAAEPSTPSPAEIAGSQRPMAVRLSILGGGQPRGSGLESFDASAAPTVDPFSVEQPDCDRSRWSFAGLPGTASTRRRATARLCAVRPIAGDFNGDGASETGVYRDGQWFIDLNGNGSWDRDDLWACLGDEQSQPLVGDWDGDGKSDIGVYGPADERLLVEAARQGGLPDAQNRNASAPPSATDAPLPGAVRLLRRTSAGTLRADRVDHLLVIEGPAGVALAGDFNGDGIDTIAVFRDGHWQLDVDGDGRTSPADLTVDFGRAGDLPVVGDFNEDGSDELAVYRGGTWIIDANGNFREDDGDRVLQWGDPADLPIAADLDGSGAEQAAVYRVSQAPTGLGR